jgi:diguanylate cyclase (GGDEF)-like protein
MIDRLTDQLSLSLTTIELRERLENLALRDGLTGLYNRHFLDEILEHDLAKLRRDGKQAALLLLDIDHFKQFNDTHGHQAGDEALRQVGATLAASVRTSDTACRYGGEEFLVFLSGCDLVQATAKAENIRAAIAAISLRINGQIVPAITASIGLAIFPNAATGRTDLVNVADLALYVAKRAGRNRVSIAESVVPAEQGSAPEPAPRAAQ